MALVTAVLYVLPEPPRWLVSRTTSTSLPTGTYLVRMEVGGQTMVRPIVVEEDIWMRQSH